MLLDGLLLAEFRRLSNGVSQGDYSPGLFHVEIFDQPPIDQDHPPACGYGLRVCSNDCARPGYSIGRRRENRIGRGNSLGMKERLAVKTECHRLVTHRSKPGVILQIEMDAITLRRGRT